MNVISAWDVYWVMQLDSIVSTIGMFAAIVGAVSVAIFVIGAIFTEMGTDKYTMSDPDRAWSACVRWSKWGAISCMAASVFVSFIPSTKTAAAMIVLPAVANNETVQTEAADLYRLAKAALADAVDADEEPAK